MTGSDTMRALVYDGPHQMHVERRPRPHPGPGEACLRLAYVGICGSDLHGYTGESGRRSPGMIMGHEASGWVEEVGEGVHGLALGQPVTFNPALPCAGGCGHVAENRCTDLRVVGVTPDIQGAFADYIVVNASRVVPLAGLDLLSASMAEPLAVAVQAVQRCQVAGGDGVLVIGGGMIGQCVARAARAAGASRVIVSESVAERLELAAEAGFDVVAPADVGELIPLDVAVDAVGISPTASAAIRAVRKGGTIGFVGLGLPEVSIPLFEVVVPERSIVGSFCYTDAVFTETVRTMASGEVDLSPLLGGTVGLEEAHDAFEDLATGKRKDVKIVVAVGGDSSGGANG